MSEEQVEYIVDRPTRKPFSCEVCGEYHGTLQQARDCERECKAHCRQRRIEREETARRHSAEYQAALVEIIKIVKGAEGVHLLKWHGYKEDMYILLYEKIKNVLSNVRGIDAQRMLTKDAEDELNKVTKGSF